MMVVESDFVSCNWFVVCLSVCLGNHVPSVSCVVTSSLARACMSVYQLLTDVFVLIMFITLSVRLLSPDVPLAERSSAVLTSITTYQSSAKILFFILNRRRFQELFDLWDASSTDLPFKDTLKDIQKTELRRVKIIALVLLVTMTGPAVPWCLMPFVPFIQHIHGGRFLAVPAWYPFDFLVSPAFEIVVVFQTVAAVFLIAKSVVFDIFFISIVALVIGRFQHLRLCMEHLFDEEHEEQVTSRIMTGSRVGLVGRTTDSAKDTTGIATGNTDQWGELVKTQRVTAIEGVSFIKDTKLVASPHIIANDIESVVENIEDGDKPLTKPRLITTNGGIYTENNADWVKLIPSCYRTPMPTENTGKLMLKLKMWSEYHQALLILGKKLHEMYSSIFFVQFLTTTLNMCFSAFIAVGVSMDVMHYMLSVAYGIACIVQLYVLCHYGDRLADASVSLSDAGLANGWQHCRVKQVTSCLKIIYQRVQIPLQIFAVSVYPLSAETFFAIMKAAVSYLMVLIELHNKSQTEGLFSNDTTRALLNEHGHTTIIYSA